MNNNLTEALNAQINEELFSAYAYLAMSAFASKQNWLGLANWLKIQAQEEVDHAMGFYNHLLERDETVNLMTINQPSFQFRFPSEIIAKALEQEKHISSKINELYELASTEKDYPAQNLLRWYINEQVEEEANCRELLDQLKLAGETGPGFYLLDQKLGGRQYHPANIA